LIGKLDVKESFLQVFAKPSHSGQEASNHCTLLDENKLLGSLILSTGTTLANPFPTLKALVVLFSKQNLAPQHSCNLDHQLLFRSSQYVHVIGSAVP
jgi:uncharacterized protein Usg